jgi:FkbM family methyltransferase
VSLSGLLRRTKRLVTGDPDRFLRGASGVIHVGANTGQERARYASYGLDVLWIEPIHEVFETLQRNLEAYPRQRALECLVTDRDDAEYEFHVANNEGQSSSIFDLKEHQDVWPKVAFTHSVRLRSKTLPSLLEAEGVDPTRYDALIMDTQGSELLVLKGAEPILGAFEYIKTEVPDFEAYAGCCRLTDIEGFLLPRGFAELKRNAFARRAGGGCYYDVVYRRRAALGRTAP